MKKNYRLGTYDRTKITSIKASVCKRSTVQTRLVTERRLLIKKKSK